MCRIKGFKSTTCPHRWLTITTRCAPGYGFTSTPVHEFKPAQKAILGGPAFKTAPADSCPICTMKGQYDGNTTRMVVRNGGMSAPFGTMGGCYTGMNGYAPYAGGNGYRRGYGYPTAGGAGFTSTGVGYGQVLTPYQQQFAANKQAENMARMQYYPLQQGNMAGGGCTVM